MNVKKFATIWFERASEEVRSSTKPIVVTVLAWAIWAPVAAMGVAALFHGGHLGRVALTLTVLYGFFFLMHLTAVLLSGSEFEWRNFLIYSRNARRSSRDRGPR